MKATTRILIGLISVALGFAGAVSFGDYPGQSSGYAADEAGRRSDDLLQRARQAMQENDGDTAEALIAQAKALGVGYGPLYQGDTPEKAARDLERMRGGNNGLSALPGKLLAPLSIGKREASVTDPFASYRTGPATGLSDPKSLAKSHILKARQEIDRGNLRAAAYWHGKAAEQRATFGPNEDSPVKLAADIVRRGGTLEGTSPAVGTPTMKNLTPLPPVDRTTSPLASIQNLHSTSFPAAGTSRQARTSQPLLAARRALAEGDVRRASEMVERAKARPVRYGPNDDTPAKVEALIRNYTDLTAQDTRRRNTESYRRQFARVLMEQAEGLLRYNDYEKAESLANLAAGQGVRFGSFQPNPGDLLKRIAEARRGATTGAPSRPGGLSSPASMSLAAAKQRAGQLIRQARASITAGNLRNAADLAHSAKRLGVPNSAFGPNEDSPDQVLLDVQRAATRTDRNVMAASAYGVVPATGNASDRRAAPAVYDRSNDPTRNRWATAQQPTPAPPIPMPYSGAPAPGLSGLSQANPGQSLFEQGEAALTAHDTVKAMDYFRQAAAYRGQLDSVTAQRLQDRLQYLNQPVRGPASLSTLSEADAAQRRLIQQVAIDMAHRNREARAMRETDPNGALALLEESRQKVDAAGLDSVTRGRMLAQVDSSLAEMQQYIEDNRARFELDERNQQTRADIERERQVRLDTQQRLKQIFIRYNELIEQGRFPEAELEAKRAVELAPNDAQAQQLLTVAKLVRRHTSNLALRDARERGVWESLDSVDHAAVPIDDRDPYQFGDVKRWENLTNWRRNWMSEQTWRRSEEDLEIERKLKTTPVLLQFENAPLKDVMDYLARMGAVNLYLDPVGLQDVAASSDDPVSISFNEEISLGSALRIILEQFQLSYVVKDGMVKITSEDRREGEVYEVAYPVADLVLPIPNFNPGSGMGLEAAYHDALGSVGFGGHGSFSGFGYPLAMGGQNGAVGGTVNSAVLTQMQSGQSPAMGGTMPITAGPGG
ncbi:MAG: ATP-binding protein, partial [Planctomycetota bacterium]